MEPWSMQLALNGSGFERTIPRTQVYVTHELSESGTFVSSFAVVIIPAASHMFFLQLPYTCEGLGPAV
jgi:hypothetical protein